MKPKKLRPYIETGVAYYYPLRDLIAIKNDIFICVWNTDKKRNLWVTDVMQFKLNKKDFVELGPINDVEYILYGNNNE